MDVADQCDQEQGRQQLILGYPSQTVKEKKKKALLGSFQYHPAGHDNGIPSPIVEEENATYLPTF